MADKIYGQYPAFVQQYGDGPAGIANYAQKTLAAKPDATLGDFYAGYVLNTANPGGHSFAELENTNLPGAQGAAYNLLKNSGYSPDTPLAAVMGGASGAGGSGGYTSPYSAAMAGAPPPQSPYSANLQNQGQEKGLLGLPKDLAGPLMAAGFGMMASRSPWAGVAIGEGGQAGLQYYQKNQELNRQYALTQAQIDNMSSEARDRDADVGLRSRQLDLQMQLMQRQIAGAAAAAGVPGSNPPVAPGLASAPGTPVAGVPAVAPARSASPLGPPMPTPIQKAAAIPTTGVPSAGPIAPTAAGAPNPAQVAALNSQMKAPAANVPAAGAQPAVATAPVSPQGGQTAQAGQTSAFNPDGSNRPENDPYWKTQPQNMNPYFWEQNRRAALGLGNTAGAAEALKMEQWLQNPETSPLAGAPAARAARAAQIAGQEAQARAGADFVETQPTPGGPTTLVPKSQLLAQAAQAAPDGAAIVAKQPAAFATSQKALADRDNEIPGQLASRAQSQQRLGDILNIMQTYTPGAFSKEKAQFQAALRATGIDVPDTPSMSASQYEELMKQSVKNVFSDVKDQGGGRILQSEIIGLTQANINPGLQPAAAAHLVGSGLGVINYLNKRDQDYAAWRQANPYAVNSLGFDVPWFQKYKNPQPFIDDVTRKQVHYAGEQWPPAGAMTSPSTGMVKDQQGNIYTKDKKWVSGPELVQ